MDIPFVFVRFRLMLRIIDAHSKSERVYVFFPFNPNVVSGVSGVPPEPMGGCKGGICGERSLLLISLEEIPLLIDPQNRFKKPQAFPPAVSNIFSYASAASGAASEVFSSGSTTVPETSR